MSLKRLLLVLMTAFVASTAGAAADSDAQLKADLQKLASQKIFFGHQSVGDNLLAGVRQLAKEAGVPINITEVKQAANIATPGFSHAYIDENTHPLKKMKSFDAAMGPTATNVDTAVMKLCYVDFSAQSDAKNFFNQYSQTIEALRARNPNTRFVHVTAPLTVVQSGVKATIKRIIGRAPTGIEENQRREEYSALVRQTYGGKDMVFDLARAESRNPDGSPNTVEWNKQAVPALVPSYTDDGSHLNAAGQRQIAREFISVLANGSPKDAARK